MACGKELVEGMRHTVRGNKHLGLWEVKPRTPPRMAKTQTLHTEPHIDYSGSQIPLPIEPLIVYP